MRMEYDRTARECTVDAVGCIRTDRMLAVPCILYISGAYPSNEIQLPVLHAATCRGLHFRMDLVGASSKQLLAWFDHFDEHARRHNVSDVVGILHNSVPTVRIRIDYIEFRCRRSLGFVGSVMEVFVPTIPHHNSTL